MSDVQLTLTHNEALVLFEVFSRFSDNGLLGTQDQSEQRALWNLQCLLESVLPETLDPDYEEVLATAQNELRDPDGTNAQYEKEQGRVAFWLEPSRIEFIVNEWRKMPTAAPEEDRKQWADIAFRAMAALHKAGVKHDPQFPTVGYELVPRESDSDSDDTIEFTS